VTVIALGKPYDLSLIEGSFTGIAAFEYSVNAFRSIIPLLDGEYKSAAQLTIQM